jgi:hypothetical protein
MNRDELLALAERVEALTGPDRETDYEVLRAVDERAKITGPVTGDPRYTASLDAAMSLVKPEWVESLYLTAHRAIVWNSIARAENMTLALTAAVLRALATQENTDEA